MTFTHQKKTSSFGEYIDLNKTSWIIEIWSLSQIFLGIMEYVWVYENIPLYVLISETFKTTKIINNSWA